MTAVQLLHELIHAERRMGDGGGGLRPSLIQTGQDCGGGRDRTGWDGGGGALLAQQMLPSDLSQDSTWFAGVSRCRDAFLCSLEDPTC